MKFLLIFKKNKQQRNQITIKILYLNFKRKKKEEKRY